MTTFLHEETAVYRLSRKGKLALSNTELLEVIIGNGKGKEVSWKILEDNHNSLAELARMTPHELMKYGIGEATASKIVAAFELGNRKRAQDALIRDKISSSRDVFDIMQPEIGEQVYEVFYVLLLNRANRVIRKMGISEGGVSGTVADAKKIFRMALEFNASSVILCHNHPSGNIRPSETDIKLTKKIKDCGINLDLPVLDHLIICNKEYYSFADEGMM